MLNLGIFNKFTCIINFIKTPILKKTHGANDFPSAIEQDVSVCISEMPIMVKIPSDKRDDVIIFSLSERLLNSIFVTSGENRNSANPKELAKKSEREIALKTLSLTSF